MTLDEVNARIKAIEKELKELKTLKRQLQCMDIFDTEKQKWFHDVMTIVEETRATKPHEWFDEAIKRVPRYEMRWVGSTPFWVWKNGLEERHLLHGWRILLNSTIAAVTKGKKCGIKNKDTQTFQLTDDEIARIKIKLNKRIDAWCAKWKGIDIYETV